MKLTIALLCLTGSQAFVAISPNNVAVRTRSAALWGYLDDLSNELYAETDNPDIEATTKEATDLAKDKVANYGVGDWSTFVEFDEFDGGDGQMGVAGDGQKGLEKFGDDVSPHIANLQKSKQMSAKVSWGTNSGYAEDLRAQGMETSRAQQLENWQNQQEVLKRRQAQRAMTETFDEVASDDEDWRTLAKFGVERNQEFDLDEQFGAVTSGPQIDGVLELSALLNQNAVYEFGLRNDYMGFADFRASFTSETGPEWTVQPSEGSISSRDDTNFIIRFRPNSPGIHEGHLVIETEDFKKTYQVIGKGG
eukprot:CAMPEP_0194210668 /NCGR_PEP_ID=MMETSP0156-20130528/8917_1 /TAXON_ID=33649 /ORGANISM="Thalassionema nitzschioides, Strain L26-B" /LENGTH=306 /DNA_ID=CAMNT_0038938039 /DNA_START=42 /DNA_END=962 /DNA_ORIENTATION=+